MNMNKIIKVLLVSAIVIFCIQVFSDNKADVDLWGNVGFVTTLPWEQGFKYVNIFSFTEPGHPWINHEWLAQYILHTIYVHFGNPGLLMLKVVLGLCVVAMIYLAMKRLCNSGIVKFLWLLLIISTIGYGFSTRPHLFTYVLYTFLLLSLQGQQILNTRYFLLFPILGIVWVNLHGAFFIGALLLIVYMILESVKKNNSAEFNKSLRKTILLLMIVVLFITAGLINPYGLQLWYYLFQSAVTARSYLSEWSSFTWLVYLAEHPDFIILFLLSFIAISFSRKPKDITWLGILCTSFIAAIIMRRNIPLFAITTGFVVPQHIEDVIAKPLKIIFDRFSQPVLVTLLALFIVISAWYTFFFNKADPFEIEVQQERFPKSAISFIEANKIAGNAFIFFDWAEYCIWKFYPNIRVFLDGRFRSAYSSKTISDYFNFLYLGDRWKNVLNNYPVDIVLIHKGNPVYRKMFARQNWILVYEDKIAALFLKKSKHVEFFKKAKEGKILYPQLSGPIYFPG
jgi:hypothetical protein